MIRKFFPNILLLFVLMVILFCGCIDRERNNPLDPKNPKTKGVPASLRIYSGHKSVTLVWEDYGALVIKAVIIYRKLASEQEFTQIAEVSGNTYSYIDKNLEYNITYVYQIVIVGDNYITPPSNPVPITLGPSFTWVVDYGAGEVIRFPYDLGQPDFRYGYFISPTVIEMVPRQSYAWISDRFDRVLYKISSEPRIVAKSDVLFQPSIMSIALNTNDIWVVEDGKSTVAKLDKIGRKVFNFGPMARPWGIATSIDGRSAWVSDLEKKQVYLINSVDSTAQILLTGLNAPRDIAINNLTGQVWIADSTQIIVMGPHSFDTPIFFDGFEFAGKLAIDTKRNECWVLEYNTMAGQGKITRFSESAGKLAEVTGLYYPVALDVDEYDGRCFVVESGRKCVTVLSSQGKIIHKIESLVNPSDVAIEVYDD